MFSILKKFFATEATVSAEFAPEPHNVFVYYSGKVRRRVVIAGIKKDPSISRFAYVAQDLTIDIVVNGVECEKLIASSYMKRNNLKLLAAKIQESLFAGLTEISVITDDPETLADYLRVLDIAHHDFSFKVEVTVVGFKSRLQEQKTYQCLYQDIKCAKLLFPGEAS